MQRIAEKIDFEIEKGSVEDTKVSFCNLVEFERVDVLYSLLA